MRVVLLGTGSADGLPNPWCDCVTCADQRPRGRRSPTSALVDDGARRLLYATDTGLLPPATLAALAGAKLDAVLLEETFGARTDLTDGHLHLETFAQTVAALREVGAVTDDTQVVAVHLGHHNPPLSELEDELARCGTRVHPDGTVLEL